MSSDAIALLHIYTIPYFSFIVYRRRFIDPLFSIRPSGSLSLLCAACRYSAVSQVTIVVSALSFDGATCFEYVTVK